MKKLTTVLAVLVFSAYFASAQYSTLLNFADVNGKYPYGSLISDGTFLYGMAHQGGSSYNGTLFKIMPDGSGYVDLLDFGDTLTGSNPYGTPLMDGGFLYGMTLGGGVNNLGTVFKIMPDGTGFVKLLDFAGTTNGAYPEGSLISDGTFLYGMTHHGGVNDLGTIFKIMPDGTGYVKLLDFAGATNGSNPRYGSLLFDGTFLYGMTYDGGANNLGVIFKIKPDGTGYAKLLDFAGTTNGGNPYGSLISDGTFLYGMTYNGGTSNFGTIFKIKPDGTGYAKLLDFTGIATGSNPYGSLIADGVFLYGITKFGGSNSYGAIFKIKPDGTGFVKLLNMPGGTNGAYSYGSLIAENGDLYGMTYFGGLSNKGAVFKFQGAAVGIEENNIQSTNIFPNPTTGEVNIVSSQNGTHLVSITNVLGKVIFSKEVVLVANSPFTIDITSEPAGTYLLRIGNSTQRIVKR